MRPLLALLAALPSPVAYGLAHLLYLLLFYLLRYRRATVRENLAFAFPEMNPAQRRVIERDSYKHFSNLAIEILRSTRLPQESFADAMTLVNPELLVEATDNFEHQAIVLLIHQGNWEWMLHGAMAQLPVPIDPVYKELHSKKWDQLMVEARSRFGATPMPLANVARAVIGGRKRKRVIVMLADQAGPKKEGYWSEFLNRPASFYRGADKLAQALKIPVLFAQCRRTARGRYDIIFHDIADPRRDDSSDNILGRYVATAERCIAEQPQTYLWTNRRWKKTPPADVTVAIPPRPATDTGVEGHVNP